MANRALLIVRSDVAADADRAPFDAWYEAEHLCDAAAALGAASARRGWSRVDPSLHYAFYEFANVDAALTALRSDAMKDLIATYDRVWGDRVTRSRDVVEVVQAIAGAGQS